jgi:hypothetical protein
MMSIRCEQIGLTDLKISDGVSDAAVSQYQMFEAA